MGAAIRRRSGESHRVLGLEEGGGALAGTLTTTPADAVALPDGRFASAPIALAVAVTLLSLSTFLGLLVTVVLFDYPGGGIG